MPVENSTDAPATPRDRHLFGPGPKRILSLDGGGVRGAITVAFLMHIEGLLDQHFGRPVLLGEYFDLIGGTSTGALIAGALAMGYRAGQIKSFYTENARLAFQPRRWQLPVVQSKFDARGLRQQIASVIGDRELGTPDLVTGLCLITKRMDTGSAWIISNNPRAPYWENGPDYLGNKHYPLANLVRASTAAPHYFDPELLPIMPKVAPGHEESVAARAEAAAPSGVTPSGYGLFVDGGVSPYNNPALALLQLVSFKAFGLQWPTGPDRLSITSIGTGTYRPKLTPDELGFAPKLAFHALLSMMADAEKLSLTLLQWLGETAQPWKIDSEIGKMEGDSPQGGKLFRFRRYDVKLEEDWLASELGYKANAAMVKSFRRMDDPKVAGELFDIGLIAAKRQVRAEDWV